MIVGIEAASTDLSVAIVEDDASPLAEAAWTSERRQSAELLPRLLALLDREGRGLGELRGIGIGTGPGSFTGLRVAMALGKGLAVALACPLVGVPSLDAWLEAEPESEAAIARAGARDAYVLERGSPEPIVAGGDAVGERFAGRRVAAPVELADAFGLTSAVSPAAARVVAMTAARRLARDPAGDALASVDPIYLRAPRGIPADIGGAAPWR